MSQTNRLTFNALRQMTGSDRWSARDLNPRLAKYHRPPVWAELVREAGYRPAAMARLLGTSLRNLQRLVQAEGRVTLSQRLNSFRQRDALALLLSGRSVKETAIELGYKRVSHFSREFKRFHQLSPGCVMREKRRELARSDNTLSRFDN